VLLLFCCASGPACLLPAAAWPGWPAWLTLCLPACLSVCHARPVTSRPITSRQWQALKALGLDGRPEVRNSAVRTLYLAAASHVGRFPTAGLRE
jgi:hypothetical protein